MENKWTRAAIPAILIHISVGTVYCWSTFKEAIAAQIKMSPFSVGWAFSLAIFFLGMSAAFSGKFVERDIHKSSLIACICFSTGMVGTGIVIRYMTGIWALLGIYLFYGIIMGIGLGIGYLTPVKTLMLWFSKNKGLATGISIMGFGLAKAIATPVMNLLQNAYGIAKMFFILGVVYFIVMYIGHLMLKKPDGWVEPKDNKSGIGVSMFKNRQFVGIWLMFFINIHCGLMIIPNERQILTKVFAASAALPIIISLVPSLTAGANALGRIGFSTLSDRLDQRNDVYKLIFELSVWVSTMGFLTMRHVSDITILGFVVIFALLIINAGYGGGFSTLPALLSERFGMENISAIHGIALTAWAVAGITGNNTAELILSNGGGYDTILLVCWIMYIVAWGISSLVVKSKSRKGEAFAG